MHVITTRSPTTEEMRRIASSTSESAVACGCFLLILAVPCCLLGYLISSAVFQDGLRFGLWIGLFLTGILFAYFLSTHLPYERRRSRRIALDREANVVDEIHVINPRVHEIGGINDNQLVLAFDIGDGKLLVLQGQWLRDPRIYGSNEPGDDNGDEFLNGMPAPDSFPSTEFRIVRFPNSGDVASIRVLGAYLKPEKTVDALKLEYEFGESELFAGDVENVTNVLAHEHQSRRNRLIPHKHPGDQ